MACFANACLQQHGNACDVALRRYEEWDSRWGSGINAKGKAAEHRYMHIYM
jgi:hypothetical protein